MGERRLPTDGHLFGSDLLCRLCGVTWAIDQNLGKPCPKEDKRQSKYFGRQHRKAPEDTPESPLMASGHRRVR